MIKRTLRQSIGCERNIESDRDRIGTKANLASFSQVEFLRDLTEGPMHPHAIESRVLGRATGHFFRSVRPVDRDRIAAGYG
jgi:hypothetical protein